MVDGVFGNGEASKFWQLLGAKFDDWLFAIQHQLTDSAGTDTECELTHMQLFVTALWHC